MNGILLDTNAALFALVAPERLSNSAKRTIAAGPNVLSVVSYWEVLLKSMKGKLDVGDPRKWWEDALEELAATPLLLRPQHVSGVHTLAHHHKDPFDRMLLAQAMVEGLVLVTSDEEMAGYASKSLRIVR